MRSSAPCAVATSAIACSQTVVAGVRAAVHLAGCVHPAPLVHFVAALRTVVGVLRTRHPTSWQVLESFELGPLWFYAYGPHMVRRVELQHPQHRAQLLVGDGLLHGVKASGALQRVVGGRSKYGQSLFNAFYRTRSKSSKMKVYDGHARVLPVYIVLDSVEQHSRAPKTIHGGDYGARSNPQLATRSIEHVLCVL